MHEHKSEARINHDKRHDARRIEKQSNKAKLWRDSHPGYDRDRRARERALYGRREPKVLDDVFNPLKVTSEICVLAHDWHGAAYDPDLFEFMLKKAKEENADSIIIGGDLWDCTSYSTFIDIDHQDRFEVERDTVAMILQVLVDEFDGRVFICRGNHEDRWIKQNLGRMKMDELFATTKVMDGYQVTNDDHIVLNPKHDPWLICHPYNFRKNPGSVVRELATKYHMNVCGAHGHQWSNNLDTSGRYRCIDGMGMFDATRLEYMRRTSCHPTTVSGFWVLRDGYPIEYRWSGDHGWAEELGIKKHTAGGIA